MSGRNRSGGCRLVVVGDALLDADVRGEADRVSPDGPMLVFDEITRQRRPGGAALAAVLAAGAGATVDLVTALGTDPAGQALVELVEGEGVTVHDLGLDGSTPEKIRFLAGGQGLLRVDRGGPPGRVIGRAGALASGRDALAASDAIVVSDYGRGITAFDGVRRALARAQRRPAPAPMVWDPHPRGARPLRATVVTPNRNEARRATAIGGDDLASDVRRAMSLLDTWRVAAVAVTMGERGAILTTGSGPPLMVPAPTVLAGDTCGAGDAFAVAVAVGLACGLVLSQAVEQAVGQAAAFVAGGGAGTWRPGPADRPGGAEVRSHASGPGDAFSGGTSNGANDGTAEAVALARSVRARGGTVVATGGCFDLLHAGHVSLLAAARQLGDALIVCLNSDTSVTRLKGPERPLQGQLDRRAVLMALDAVDTVVVFDDDTPVEVLDRIRPHIFVKGGDYAGIELPEADLCAVWGGQAVTVPYLSGRSTTRLLQEARRGR